MRIATPTYRNALFGFSRPRVTISLVLLFTFVCVLFSSNPIYSQSTNCFCTNNLLTNGTFEDKTSVGWTTVTGIIPYYVPKPQTYFSAAEPSYDDCGTNTIRLWEVTPNAIADPAFWQQENNVDPGRTYTLAFDAGTDNPMNLHRVYLRFYDSAGNLLSENYQEVNHEVGVNNDLQSYRFSMNAPNNSSFLRIEVAMESDFFYFDNVCLTKIECTAPTLSMQSPSHVTGTYLRENSTYRYYNAYPNTDAILTILDISHSDIVIDNLDEPAVTYGGYDWAFQPVVFYNFYNGGNSFDPPGEKSITFRFDFVDAITGAPVEIPQLNMTAVDIDGAGSGDVTEFIEASSFQGYEVQSPSELTLTGALRARGASNSTSSGIDEAALETMISYIYNSSSSVTFTYGARFTGYSSGTFIQNRLNCLFFKCYDFNTQVICPTIAISGGTALCSGNSITLQASTSGGAGTCTIQWQSSNNGTNWSNIIGANGDSYVTPSLANSEYYRATLSCSGNLECGLIVTDAEYVEILPSCVEICGNGIDDDMDGYTDEEDADCINYYNCQPLTNENLISGTVFNDENGNQLYEDDEVRQVGMNIELYEDLNNNGTVDAGDQFLEIQPTDINGSFQFLLDPISNGSLNLGVTSGCDDAHNNITGNSELEFGKDEELGLRYTGVNIPNGATIVSASLFFTSAASESSTGTVMIYGEDSGSSQDFCADGDIGNRNLTSARKPWKFGNWTQGEQYQSVDISNIIQSIVDNSSGLSNDEITLLLLSNGIESFKVKSFETHGDGSGAPRLHIEFTTNQSSDYVIRMDPSFLPGFSTFTTPNEFAITFNSEGGNSCGNNFGFNGPAEICNNGIDDDGDTLVDGDDPDCSFTVPCLEIGGDNTISGTVFFDPNQDGEFDFLEPTQDNVTIRLYEDVNQNGLKDNMDVHKQTDITDNNGYYSFTEVNTFAGTYSGDLINGYDDATDSRVDEVDLKVGKDRTGGLRFSGVTLPASAIIQNAFITVVSDRNKDMDPSIINIYGEDVPSPVNYNVNPIVSTRTRTSNSEQWIFGEWESNQSYVSPNIKTIIQELISTHGEYANGTIALILDPQGSHDREFKTFEHNNDGTDVPTLHIEYTIPGDYRYLIEVDTTTLPPDQAITGNLIHTAVFNYYGESDCRNDFGFSNSIEICGNNIDDDGDGLVDCADGDCFNNLTVSLTTGNNPLCIGEETTLLATGSGGRGTLTYTWDQGLGQGFSKTVSPSAQTTYTVTISDINGCTSSDQITLNISQNPTVDAGSNQTICNGEFTTLTAVGSNGGGGYNYSWNNGLGDGDVRSIQPDATTIYTVTITDINGCTDTDQVTITVNSLPEVNTNSDQSICQGESATISATASGGSGGYSYTWNNGLGIGAIKNPSPSSTTTYTAIVSDSQGCTSSDQIIVNINPAPPADAGSNEIICFGEGVQLTATGGQNYTWSPSTSLDNDGIANPYATPTTNTVYTVTVTGANGCTSTDQVAVNVNVEPSANAGSDDAICNGESSQLNASGGVGYSWSPSIGLSSDNVNNPIATPLTSTTYTVTVEDIAGCTAVDQVVINVNNLPTADAGFDATICIGNSTTLNATGGDTYLWNPSAGLSANNISNPIAQPTSTMTYTVLVTDSNGCTNTDQVTVSVTSLPTAEAGSNLTTCIGQSVNLDASGGVAYEWSPTTGLSSNTINNPTAQPLVSTTYTVTVTSASGCTDTDQIIITIGSCPEICGDGLDNDGDGLADCLDPDCGPTAHTAGPDQNLCLGSNTLLAASGGAYYDWSPNIALSNPKVSNPTASPTTTTTYTVTVTDAAGCTASDEMTIFVHVPPIINLAQDTVDVCIGGNVDLIATGGVSYEWGPTTGLDNPFSATPKASPSTSTLYIVTVTDINGCDGTAGIYVVANTNTNNAFAGSDGTICLGSSTILAATGGVSYLWSPSTGLDFDNIANPTASPAVSTTYTVIVTDDKGCSDVDDVFIEVIVCSEVCGDDIDNDSDGLKDCDDPECQPEFPSAGPDKYICLGESTMLTASGGVSYEWTPPVAMDNDTSATPIVSPVSTTTYTVEVMNANGCTKTDEVIVFVSPRPMAVVSSDTIHGCMGEPVLLSASGGLYYSWSPASSLDNPSVPNPIANPTVSTLYVVTVSDGNGCYATDVTYVELNSNVGNADAGPDLFVCEGGGVQLSATGGATYSWSPTIGLDNPNIANPTATPSVPIRYTVVATDINGCSGTDDVFVDVISFTGNADAGSDSEICRNTSTVLSASGGVSYLWTPSDDLDFDNIANPIASPLISTVYTVEVTDINGCTDTDQVTLSVFDLPVATISQDTAEICSGAGVTLFASGGYSYQWSPSTGLSDVNIPNPQATPSTSTLYIVSVSDINGCESTDAVYVKINDSSSDADAGADVEICQGEFAQLVGSGGILYKWSPSAGLNNDQVPNPRANPITTTTYTLQTTNINGCTDTDQVTVFVNPEPAITVSSTQSVCSGDSISLFASGALSYSWSPSTGLSSTTIANPKASPSALTTYIVVATDSNGCTGSEEIIVNVNSNVGNADAGSDKIVCQGDYIDLNATGGVSFVWSPAESLDDENVYNPKASPLVTTIYTVTVTDANGCTDIDQVQVSVNQAPVATIAQDTLQACVDEGILLFAGGGIIYDWGPTSGLNNSKIPNPTATPSTSTLYIVTVTDINGCTGTDAVFVNVNSYTNTATAGPDEVICGGEGTTLSATGGTSYSWSPTTGLSDPFIANPIASPATTTIYTVTAFDANGCSGTDDTEIIVLGSPPISINYESVEVCKESAVQLIASGGVSYQWSPADGLSDPTSPSPLASPDVSTLYTLVVTDGNGCSATDGVFVQVNDFSADGYAGTDVTICPGESVGLSASGGQLYKWGPAEGLNDIFSANPIASPEKTTFYKVTITDIKGCTSEDEVIVFVRPDIPLATTSDRNICEGESVTLGVTGGLTYTWSPNTNIDDVQSTSPIVTPPITTTYTVIATDANGCTASDEIEVVVNEQVTATIIQDTISICNGNPANLTVQGGSIYSWYPTNGLSDSTTASVTASPVVSTTYYVIVSNGTICEATDSIYVRVNGGDNADGGGDRVVCTGNSITLGASGGDFYSWSPSTGMDNPNIANPTFTPTASGFYTVSVSDNQGCSGTDQVFVEVLDNPTVTINNPNPSICLGNSFQLDATGGTTYSWSPIAGLDNPNISNPIATPTASTTYTVIITDAQGCQSTLSSIVTVNQNNSADAGEDIFICQGSNGQLDASGGVSYTWSPTTGLNFANIPNPEVTVASTTTYTVVVTDANGCTASDDVIVQVSNGLLSADAGTDQSICLNESVTLNASGGTNYSWSPSTGMNDANISNPTLTPTQSAVYTVTVSDDNGCSGTAEVLVEVLTRPTPSINDTDFSICIEDSVQLISSGGISYSWLPAEGLSDAAINNPKASPSVSTVYTVTISDSNGCTATISTTVEVNENTSADAGTDAFICQGSSTILGATGGVNYSWTPSSTLDNPNSQNPTANPTTTTTYTVVVTDANGCTDSDDVLVEVSSQSAGSADAGSDVVICKTEEIRLNASGGVSYAWSPTSGLNNASVSNPKAYPDITTIYTVTVTDENGCTSTDEVEVQVNPLPFLEIELEDVAICLGSSIQLEAEGTGEFSWFPETDIDDPTIANPTVNPQESRIYFLTVTDANGCYATDLVFVEVTTSGSVIADAGEDVTLCTGGSAQLSGSGGVSYEWSPTSGLTNAFIANPVASPNTTTTYTLTTYDENGCFNTDEVVVNIENDLIANSGGDRTICNSQSVQLSASGGNTYTWSPSTGLSDPNIANPIASPTSTILYTVTVSDGSGCSDTDVALVLVSGNLVADAGNDIDLCFAETTQLSASGGDFYTWSPSEGLSDVTIANPTVEIASTTTYTVTVEDINGCTGSDEVIVTIHNTPSVNITQDITTSCSGNITTLTADGGISYEWSPALGLNADNIASPIATPSESTTYTVTVTDENGCTDTATTFVEATIVNTLVAYAGEDVIICQGNNTQLDGAGGTTYTWSPVSGLNNPNIANPIASPTVTTTYTLTTSNGDNCTATDEITIQVTPSLNVSVTPENTTICKGEEIDLFALGGDNYSWSPTDGLSDPNISSPEANPETTTTYTVTISENGGCSASVSVEVIVVEENPLASAGEDVAICQGESTNLNAQGGESYIWSPAVGLSDINIANPVVDVDITTTYTVMIIDDNGCTSSDALTVIVNTPPVIVTNSDQKICAGESVTLQATGGTTYLWSPAVGLDNPNIPNPTATPTENTLYDILVTDANGCASITSLFVEVTEDLDNDGICVPPDNCPLDANPDQTDTDGDGVGDSCDIDDDNDGILDIDEDATAYNNGDTDHDGVPDRLDLDSDNDGILDFVEGQIDASLDIDRDGMIDPFTILGPNGYADMLETSPESGISTVVLPNTDQRGAPDYQDLDSDDDGFCDLYESGVNTDVYDTDHNGVVDGIDADGDGIMDNLDRNTNAIGSPRHFTMIVDMDGDGVYDYQDLDRDDAEDQSGDGENDDITEAGFGYLDLDEDGLLDLTTDTDNDGIEDSVDDQLGVYGGACSFDADSGLDTDGDGYPDNVDVDDDNDGILDIKEELNATNMGDSDGDGIPDRIDLDSDNDGTNDVLEAQHTDADGDGQADGAVNNVGLVSSVTGDEICTDTDGDDVPDYLDLDSDGDGVLDIKESGNIFYIDLDGDGRIDDIDSDSDGIANSADNVDDAWGETNDFIPIDTDNDQMTNLVDTDDDGDGIPTTEEDTNGDGDWCNDDTDGDGVVDYLDEDPFIFALVNVMLQGAYDQVTGLMRDDLRRLGVIPLNQPYNMDMNYTMTSGGLETVDSSVFEITGRDAIVDWMIIELREESDHEIIAHSRAALIQRDGDVVDLDGVSQVVFLNAEHSNYYVGVKHRNHLGIMSANAVSLDHKETIVDFAYPFEDVWSYPDYRHSDHPQFTFPNGIKALWGGNVDFNNKVIFQGANVDPAALFIDILSSENNANLLSNYIVHGYNRGDVDMNGMAIFQGSPNDVDLIFYNGLAHPENTNNNANFIINEQLPPAKN